MNFIDLLVNNPSPAWQILRSARPRQWLKNLSIFIPIIFSGQLFEAQIVYTLLAGFVIFCLASSAAYLINDLIDRAKDRSHPFKKFRPIASGKLRPPLVIMAAASLIAASLTGAYLLTNRFFFSTLILFFLLQLSYSFFLRNIIIIDSLTVAAASILRVFAGSFAVKVSVSSWLILATTGIALLLSFGKRRSERTVLSSGNARIQALLHPTRTTLLHYPDSLLDSMISVSATLAIIAYSQFAFQISPHLPTKILISFLPPTLVAPKWMMITIPLVIYGVARYLYVIYEKKEGESPERVLLSDTPLLATVVLWLILTLAIIYGV